MTNIKKKNVKTWNHCDKVRDVDEVMKHMKVFKNDLAALPKMLIARYEYCHILLNIYQILTQNVKQTIRICFFQKNVQKEKRLRQAWNVANMGWGYQYWPNIIEY